MTRKTKKTAFAIFVVSILAFMFIMAGCDIAKTEKIEEAEVEVGYQTDTAIIKAPVIESKKGNIYVAGIVPYITSVEYDGHKYIVAYSCNGVDIEHSASCKCHETKQD